MPRRQAYLTLQHGLGTTLGTLYLELYEDTVPKTVQNFVTICSRPTGGYRDCPVHRLIPGFMLQTGDTTNGDGTGGESIYNGEFPDENFLHSHKTRGTLSMANAGPNTNSSQFFVTFRPTPHLDGKHVVFGQVDLQRSGAVLDLLEKIKTGENDRPLQPITIAACGVMEPEQAAAPEQPAVAKETEKSQESEAREAALEEPVEEELSDDDVPRSKSEALKHRLRKLKQKMNQARNLNRQAVQEEGERLTGNKERKRVAAVDKKNKEATLQSQQAKAMATASEAGIDGKYLVEQGTDSVQRALEQAQKDELNQFAVNDYYNPEGQHRNYVRSLKSLPKGAEEETAATDATATYNPLQTTADPERERQGARRLAQELHRRIEKSEKSKLKRKKDDDSGDVSYINQRNKRFNEKINRTYDKSTAEIRQNLERGTAL